MAPSQDKPPKTAGLKNPPLRKPKISAYRQTFNYLTTEDTPGEMLSSVDMLKVIYVVSLFLLGMGLVILTIMPPQEKIELREFPYPYRAAFAISNDINGTDSPQEFLAIQRYLCTPKETPWGQGLDLEAGSSFWFYDLTGKSHFTVFQPIIRPDTIVFIDSTAGIRKVTRDTSYNYEIDLKLNRYPANIISDFVKAGYIDALGGYGPSADYGFDREFALKARDFIRREQLTVPIWINLAGEANYQNIGRNPHQQGDNPASRYYHSDLFGEFGIKYLNLGGYTAMIGQESDHGVFRWLVKQYDLFRSAFTSSQDKNLDINWNNRLLNSCTLGDGQHFRRFRRFINPEGIPPSQGYDVRYLQYQLTPAVLKTLISAGGYMILETRLGANRAYSELIPQEARKALELLADSQLSGSVLVTTPGRLLDYFSVSQAVKWEWYKKDEAYIIEISDTTSFEGKPLQLTLASLQGLTFYTPYPEKTQIVFAGEAVEPLQINFEDHTKKSSVSIPWKKLTFPQDY